MKIVVCLALVVICSAQMPRPCESPKQWEGKRLRVDLNKQLDLNKQYTEVSRIWYDETNKRTRTIEEVDMDIERDYFDILRLHAAGKEYRLNLKTRQCNVTKISLPFRKIGVPPGARYMFESKLGYIGVPGEHLTATVYRGTFGDGATFMVQVTSPDCIPLNIAVRSNTTDENYRDSYYDIQLGIRDIGAFLPQQGCMRAK